MIGSLMSRMADAEKLSIPQLQKSIQDGIIPAYVGVPLLQDKLKQQKAAAAPQQPAQPPIAQQVMAEASQHGIDSAPSNLPTEMAGGGIVAFDDGGLSEDDEDDTDNQKQDLAMFQRNLAAIAGDNDEDLNEDEEIPEGIVAVMPRGKETENRGVGINPESKGGFGIKDMLAAKAKENKLPPELLNKIAGIESGYKSTAVNPNSTAKGLFQFTDSTWKGMGGKQGEQFDPEKNAELGAKFVRQNAEGLKGALGRNPTYGEVYASHFFGLKGAKDLLNMDPKTPMNQAVSAQVLKANPQLKDKTVGQVMAGLNNKMGEGIVSLAGGGIVAFGDPKLNPNENQVVEEEPESALGAFFKKGIIPEFGTKSEKDKKFGEDYLKGLKLKEQQQKALTAPDLNLPFYQAVKPSERKLVEDKRKAILGGVIPQATPTTPAKPQFNVQPSLQEMGPTREELGAGPADMRSEDTKAQDEINAKIKEAEAAGRGDEDIATYREMLEERAKSAKNQKSIDNYMALLQAGLGMMGGTSPYASANIGQGASKGIAHLADSRRSQIADENAILTGRLGLSRAQLYEQSRKDALAAKIKNDANRNAYNQQMIGVRQQQAGAQLGQLRVKGLTAWENSSEKASIEADLKKQKSDWKNDPKLMGQYKIAQNRYINNIMQGGEDTEAPSFNSLK